MTRRRRRKYWEPPYMVPPVKAVEHIGLLRGQGMTLVAIGKAAGFPRVGTLHDILSGKRTAGILATTEARIVAVRLQRTVVPALGVQRRVRALAALGYTSRQIAAEAGVEKCVVDRALRSVGATMLHCNAEPLVRAFNRLAMTPAAGPLSVRQRNFAKRSRWAPPLAWDDIDNPKAHPVGITRDSRSKHGIDEVAIQRRMAGDRSVHVHGDESAEVVRRLFAAGYSSGWIEQQTGLKADRYVHVTKKEEAA